MSQPTFVILAAGEGTRMRSAVPKVLHEVCGRPLVLWPVLAAREAAPGARIVLVDNPKRRLAAIADDHGLELAVQERPNGTGDAVRAAARHIEDDAAVVVLSGDVPLLRSQTIAALLEAHGSAGAGGTMLTMELEDPTGYGRVVRDPSDGTVLRVVETKEPGDATAAELEIREVNSGVFAFDGAALKEALQELRADNAQGEYYLPDVLPLLRAKGRTVAAHEARDADELRGINHRGELAEVGRIAQRRINAGHAERGVTIVDLDHAYIGADVRIGQDATIEPNSHLKGRTEVGAGCVVGPSTTLIDCTLHEGARVVHSYAVEATLHPAATAGPFAYLRPGTVLHDGAKAGTFVEIKNSTVGAGSKVPHLSYIGDAEVGPGSNIGAGTITANYDGRRKHRTTIGANVRISVDTMLVAPVEVGDGAFTGAGSVITEDVPPGALGIARERQTNIDGYADRQQHPEGAG